MDPKCVFLLGKLSMEWWERHPQSNISKYGEKRLMNNTYPARGANAEGSNYISRDNFGLECQMHQARLIDCTEEKGTTLILGLIPRILRCSNTRRKAPTLWLDANYELGAELPPDKMHRPHTGTKDTDLVLGRKVPTYQRGRQAWT